MPGKVKVRIVAGRNLPVMDRSNDTTDAYVEVKLGQVTYKTDVCRKSLNPQWNSEWFRFEMDDLELQDEPLQIRLMDHDTYSANDAIGKVYLDLSPLLINSSKGKDIAGRVISGWIPVFDTMHGIRGEVSLVVKVELFSDLNKFRQSSCGVRFFFTQAVPEGYLAHTIQGFVEELVVNDDPEYQWIDKIRTPRASNEARQTLFSKLSGEVQRRVGLKALELGGNAVIGYKQCFDLEGESGIVVRGIGTAIFLTKLFDSQLSPTCLLDPALLNRECLESQPRSQGFLSTRSFKKHKGGSPGRTPRLKRSFRAASSSSMSQVSPTLLLRQRQGRQHALDDVPSPLPLSSLSSIAIDSGGGGCGDDPVSGGGSSTIRTRDNLSSSSTRSAFKASNMDHCRKFFNLSSSPKKCHSANQLVSVPSPSPLPFEKLPVSTRKPNIECAKLTSNSKLIETEKRNDNQETFYHKQITLRFMESSCPTPPPTEPLTTTCTNHASSHKNAYDPNASTYNEITNRAGIGSITEKRSSQSEPSQVVVSTVIHPEVDFCRDSHEYNLVGESVSFNREEMEDSTSDNSRLHSYEPSISRPHTEGDESEPGGRIKSPSKSLVDFKLPKGSVGENTYRKTSLNSDELDSPSTGKRDRFALLRKRRGSRKKDKFSTNGLIKRASEVFVEKDTSFSGKTDRIKEEFSKLFKKMRSSGSSSGSANPPISKNNSDLGTGDYPPSSGRGRDSSISSSCGQTPKKSNTSPYRKAGGSFSFLRRRRTASGDSRREAIGPQNSGPLILNEMTRSTSEILSMYQTSLESLPSLGSEPVFDLEGEESDPNSGSLAELPPSLEKSVPISDLQLKKQPETNKSDTPSKISMDKAKVTKFIEDLGYDTSKPLKLYISSMDALLVYEPTASAHSTLITKGPNPSLNSGSNACKSGDPCAPLTEWNALNRFDSDSDNLDSSSGFIHKTGSKERAAAASRSCKLERQQHADSTNLGSPRAKGYSGSSSSRTVTTTESSLSHSPKVSLSLAIGKPKGCGGNYSSSTSQSSKRARIQNQKVLQHAEAKATSARDRKVMLRERKLSRESSGQRVVIDDLDHFHQFGDLTTTTTTDTDDDIEDGSSSSGWRGFKDIAVHDIGVMTGCRSPIPEELSDTPVNSWINKTAVPTAAVVVAAATSTTTMTTTNPNSTSPLHTTNNLPIAQSTSPPPSLRVHNPLIDPKQSPRDTYTELTENGRVLDELDSSNRSSSGSPEKDLVVNDNRSPAGIHKDKTSNKSQTSHHSANGLQHHASLQHSVTGGTLNRRSSESDLSTPPKGTPAPSAHGRSFTARSGINFDNLEMLEFPFITISQFPPGFIYYLGGTVTARSVKVLERITNLDEPETRDAWWNEIRMEIRSHCRSFGCTVVLGYEEHTTMCDDVCILSASGTAAVVISGNLTAVDMLSASSTSKSSANRELGEMFKERNSSGSGSSQPNVRQSSYRMKKLLSANQRLIEFADEDVMVQGLSSLRGAKAGGGGVKTRHDSDASSQHDPACGLLHIPRTGAPLPIPVRKTRCALCKKAKVSDILVVTIEIPQGLHTSGRTCLIQAQVFRPKRDVKGEASAKEVSDSLPFLEYELHRRLINKLKVKGMNAIFGLQVQICLGDKLMVAVATGTAVFLTALPPPNVPIISAGNLKTDAQKVAQFQKVMQEAYDKNREVFCLKDIVIPQNQGSNTSSDEDDSDDELEDELGHRSKHTYVLEVDDAEDIDIISMLIDSSPPVGYNMNNIETLLGMEEQKVISQQMFCQVWRCRIPSLSLRQFTTYFDRLIRSVIFKLRRMQPCVLSKLSFRVELPEQDEMQLSIIGLALGTESKPQGLLPWEASQIGSKVTFGVKDELDTTFPLEEEPFNTSNNHSSNQNGTTNTPTASSAIKKLSSAISSSSDIKMLDSKNSTLMIKVPSPSSTPGVNPSSSSGIFTGGQALINVSSVISVTSSSSSSSTTNSIPQNSNQSQSNGTSVVGGWEACNQNENTAAGILSQTNSYSVRHPHTKSAKFLSMVGANKPIPAPMSKMRYWVEVTPLSYIHGGKIDKYLGNLNFFFIRETTSIRENGGLSGFVHNFITEVLAIVRAHVAALGGNAMVSYFMTECALLHNPHKNQGQVVVNVGGDAVYVLFPNSINNHEDGHS